MQIKFINTSTLDSQIINVKGGTLEETLAEASKEITGLKLESMVRNENILGFDGFIGDIIYYGTPKNEQAPRGRIARDWTDEIEIFDKHYSDRITAKQLSVKSGLSLSHVYYIAKKKGVTLAAGKRGRR